LPTLFWLLKQKEQRSELSSERSFDLIVNAFAIA